MSVSLVWRAFCLIQTFFERVDPLTVFSFVSRSKDMEISFPIYKKEDKDHDYHTIDGLSFLTDDIVGKWSPNSYIKHITTVVYMLKKLHPFIQYYNFAPISKIRRIIVWIAMNLCTDMVLNSSFFLLFFTYGSLSPSASKNYMHGCIYLWSWSRTKAQRPDKKSRAVCAVVLAELQWTNTEIPYLALNTCPGKNKSSNENLESAMS